MKGAEVLRAAGERMDENLVRMRQRLWQTEEEAHAEIVELLRTEPPSPLRPTGHRWQEVFSANLHKWLSRRRRNR